MKQLLMAAVGLAQVLAIAGAQAGQLIASVVPMQKFTGDNVLVLGNLGLKQNFSISFWAQAPKHNPDWAAILDYRHNSTKSFAFHQKGNELNHYSFGVHSAKGVHGAYAKLAPGIWHQMVLVKSPGRMVVYQDGKVVDEAKFDKKFTIDYAGDEVLTVGGWGYGKRRWLGAVSCLFIYDYPIDEKKVQRLAKQVECTKE